MGYSSYGFWNNSLCRNYFRTTAGEKDLQKACLYSNHCGIIHNLCHFNNDQVDKVYDNNYLDALGIKRENEDFCIKGTFVFHFSIGFEILCITRTAAELINMITSVILFWYVVKVVNVIISFHYWKRSLKNTLKYICRYCWWFDSFMLFVRIFTYVYMYVYFYMYICVYTYILCL